jgi:Ca2+-binding EF-hand superfamily protein
MSNIAIIFFLVSSTLSLRGDTNVKFEISSFAGVINSLKSSYKMLHSLSNELFHTASGVGNKRILVNSIPTEAFLKVVNEAFPLDQEAIKKVPVELINTWVLIKDDSELAASINRETAYKVVQSKSEYATLSKQYAGAHFKAGGQGQTRVQEIVEAISQAYIDLEKLSYQLFDRIDKNKNGQVDFKEFLTAFGHLFPHGKIAQARPVFDKFDIDHSGYLDKLEAYHALAIILMGQNEYYVLKSEQSVNSNLRR